MLFGTSMKSSISKYFESPEELENAIRAKVKAGHTGRITAGFCWTWSDSNSDGTLKDDVVIGDYQKTMEC